MNNQTEYTVTLTYDQLHQIVHSLMHTIDSLENFGKHTNANPALWQDTVTEQIKTLQTLKAYMVAVYHKE